MAAKALSDAGVPHLVQGAGNLFSVFFVGDDEAADVVDFAGAQRQHLPRFRAFFHEMLSRGVYLPPSAFEAWFVSAAHDDPALDRIGDALPYAAAAAAAVGPEGSHHD
jgi:glutamate-1-semialdehyde 2,1-aminomutase